MCFSRMPSLTSAERAVFERAWPALTPADVNEAEAEAWFQRHFPDRQETAVLTDSIIRDAENVKMQIQVAVRDMELAMEREQIARRGYVDAKQAYDDAEAEFAFEAMQSIEGKDAETRKAALDVALIRARTEGPLAWQWERINYTRNEADAAKLALDQMIRRFRAIEAVADLTTAQLRALSR